MLSYYLSILENDDQKRLFAEVYIAYHVSLEKYAMYLLRNRQDAEDAMQNAFTRTADRFERFCRVPEEKRFYWIKNLVRWNSYAILRKRNQEIPIDDWSNRKVGEESTSAYNDMIRALAKLSDRYREPLELRVVYGYSGAEIAKHLGISEQAVYTRLSRGREKFRKQLEREGLWP